MGQSSLLEHFLVVSRDVLPLRYNFCSQGPRMWQSTPRDVATFSLSFFFFGHARSLGICGPRRIVAVHPPKRGKRRLHLEEPSNWDSLYVALWRNWPLNAPPKNADSELRHSNSEGANYKHHSLHHHTEPSTWFWSCCFKVNTFHNVAWGKRSERFLLHCSPTCHTRYNWIPKA